MESIACSSGHLELAKDGLRVWLDGVIVILVICQQKFDHLNQQTRFISAEKAELKHVIDGKEAFITEQLNNTSTSVTLPS